MSNKRLKVDTCSFLRTFYASVNAIITYSKYVNEDVRLRLFESFSLPLLTYGLNVIHLSAGQLNNCLEQCIQKDFWYETVGVN